MLFGQILFWVAIQFIGLFIVFDNHWTEGSIKKIIIKQKMTADDVLTGNCKSSKDVTYDVRKKHLSVQLRIAAKALGLREYSTTPSPRVFPLSSTLTYALSIFPKISKAR